MAKNNIVAQSHVELSPFLDKFINITPEQLMDVAQEVITDVAFQIETDAKAACPVRTGNLRASIHTNIYPLEAEVGTLVDYAPYVEYGTSKMNAQPFLEPAFYANVDRITPEIDKRLMKLGGKSK